MMLAEEGIPPGVRAIEAPATRKNWYGRLVRSEFLRHGALVFLATNLANALAYAFHFFASRALGVQLYGELSSLIAVIAIASFPASIASMIVVKYAAELNAAGDAAKVRALIRGTVSTGALTGLALAIVGIAVSRPLANFLHLDTVTDVVALTVLIAVGFILSGLRGVLLGVQNFPAFATTVAIEALCKVTLSVGLIYAGFKVTGAMGGFIASTLVALAVCWIALRGYARAPHAKLSIDVRRLVKSFVGVSLGMASLTVMMSLDMLLAKHYLDAASAGYYGVLAQAGKIVTLLSAFVPTLVLPKASARVSRGAPPIVVLQNAGLVSALLLGGVLTAFYFLPRLLITAIGGGAFAPAAQYVFPYGIAMTALALLQIVVYYKISLHRFDFVVPVAAGVAAQIAGVALWHAGIAQIVDVLIVVNAATLLACLYRIHAPCSPLSESSSS